MEVQDSRSLAGDIVVEVLDQVGLDFHLIGRRQSQVLVGQAILRWLGDLFFDRATFITHTQPRIQITRKHTSGKQKG